MPDGRGQVFEVLKRAALRGVNVRLIFWRPDEQTESLKPNTFWGSAEHIDRLVSYRFDLAIRWDRAAPGFCQHQKSWLIDAGKDSQTSFVGGINLNPHSVVAPGHRGEGQNHDVYVELTGPSALDVHKNFVQRWNEASERFSEGGCWGRGSHSQLPLPTMTPTPHGGSIVQVQRTMPTGENSIWEQYCTAIDGARRSIYIENQAVEVPELVPLLDRALQRGVEIVTLVPRESKNCLSSLRGRENFTFASIAGLGLDGTRKAVHVHAKVMLIDDEWATIGSCNLHRHSLFGNAEMNVSFYDPATVRRLRLDLFGEHLDCSVESLDERAAHRLFRQIAIENGRRSATGDHAWQGLAVSI